MLKFKVNSKIFWQTFFRKSNLKMLSTLGHSSPVWTL